MMGYDTLLSSYYDHYVLDYELFEPWKFEYSTFQIPTGTRIHNNNNNNDNNNNNFFKIPTSPKCFSVGPAKLMYNTVTIEYNAIRYD